MIAWILRLGPILAGLVGIIFGVFRTKQAQTTEAQAKQQAAEVKQQDAERTAAAAQSTANAAKERTDVENEIAGMSAADRDKRLRDDWTRP